MGVHFDDHRRLIGWVSEWSNFKALAFILDEKKKTGR
jgi:hypothetical protein